ncbi:hypothetical protein KBB96_12210 [Luteolibacter ambystomatis]|uniref:Uncharacterized protein n=1 Tax=Luteolibacter ambystomatis TaxID=2824561 RepID=A0A975IXS2_9BACT|nr:hypothetical protein [Luteolibacter ambystomatis]QUE49636.1 hypothetical protein KBB96_12210 [Luteolibacter ambystomatis]
MKPLQLGSSEYESGWWVVSEGTARKLVGGGIYFHKAQASPSYFGGIIDDFCIETQGERSGRIIFKFRADPANFRGFSAGADGWGNEKKIVL